MSTACIVESESVDSILGHQILNRKPLPFERMDYSVLQPWLRTRLSEPVKVLAVVREGEGIQRGRSAKFWGALQGLHIQLVFAERYAVLNNLCRADAPEVVHHVVAHCLSLATSDNIVYVGHGFHAADALLQQKERGARVFAAAFCEHLSSAVIDAVEEVFDLERDMGAFRFPLPRLDCV